MRMPKFAINMAWQQLARAVGNAKLYISPFFFVIFTIAYHYFAVNIFYEFDQRFIENII